MNEIKKETFEGMDVSSKLNVLFDLQTNVAPHCKARAAHCDGRFEELERDVKRWGIAHLFLIPPFSFLGGFIALVAKTKLFGGN